MQKQLEGTQKYINEQWIELPIDGQLIIIAGAIHNSFQRSIRLKY